MTLRSLLFALAAAVGASTLSLLIADFGAAKRPLFPTDPVNSGPLAAPDPPSWQALLPLVSDVEADHALIAAFKAMGSTGGKQPPRDAAEQNRAISRIKQSLSTSPSDAELWLALAILEARRNPSDLGPAQALKMAYFTAPNDDQLMPARLQTATSSELIADPELKELVRGDVRLMISRRPSQVDAVILAYRRASKLGKDFLEETIRSIDPSVLPTVRG